MLLVVTALGITNRAHGQGQVVINGFDGNSMPFAYLDDADTPQGFDIEVLNRIAELEGLQMVHEEVIFDDLIPTLQGEFAADGETIDLIDSGLTITPEREAQVSFTTSYIEVKKVLLVPADSDLTPDQLLSGGRTIAVRDGSTEADWIESNLIEKQGRSINLNYYESFDEALDDMESGSVDAIAMDELTANSYVDNDGVKTADTFGMPPAQVAFAVRKDDAALLSALNEGLALLMASPEWDVLKQKYGLDAPS